MQNNLFFKKNALENRERISIPGRRDPRYLLLVFLGIYVLYAISNLGYARSFSQYFVVVLMCVGCDLLFQFLLYQKISIFPLSSFITAQGIFLIVNSPHLWIYVVVSLLTLLLKFSVRWKGKHIFNPNNIGIVICLILFDNYMTTSPGMWVGDDFIHVLIFLLGTYISIKVNRHILVFSFILSFLFFGLVLTYYLTNFTSWFYFLPLTGTAFSLYLFYMITDPKTSPGNRKMQVLAGFTLAMFDAFFRYKEEKYSLLFASTCNTILFFLIYRGLDYFKKSEFSELNNS